MALAMNDTTLDLIEGQILGLRSLAKKLEQQRDEAREEIAHLKRENAQLWESVHELQDMRGGR